MSRIPESDRSSASGVQNITGALSQAGSAALTGTLILHQGYGMVFQANAVLALLGALVVFLCLTSEQRLAVPGAVH
jgi:predicted MFS family arabinose efflux permease